MQLVSIIMPYYQKINYVLNAINSVVSQTYQNYGLIIIYDDSDEKDLEILKKITLDNKSILYVSWNKYRFSPNVLLTISKKVINKTSKEDWYTKFIFFLKKTPIIKSAIIDHDKNISGIIRLTEFIF